MEDIATFVKSANLRKAINLFQWMHEDQLALYGQQPATLLDDGSLELLLNGDPRYPYLRTDIETLCKLGFLQREQEMIKLTDKARRLVKALQARADKADLVGPDWIVVAHEEVFIDEGATPPDLTALIGGEWNFGDRIVITCHNPDYALVCRLPLALAENDPIFIDDLKKVSEDFKYADADVDAQ